MSELLDSPREFQLWRAVVGHHQLLLRSTKTPSNPTRVDVYFKPVTAMKLRTVFHGLRVRLASDDEAALILAEALAGSETSKHGLRVRLASDDEAALILAEALAGSETSKAVFVLESGGFSGYFVAGGMKTLEDDGEYGDASGLMEER